MPDNLEYFTDFLDHLGLAPKVPTPIPECTVPTVPLTMDHLRAFRPSGLETLALESACQLAQRGPHSFQDLQALEDIQDKLRGVVALYYHGDDPLYTELVSVGSTCPVYIGHSNDIRLKVSEHHHLSLVQTALIQHTTARIIVVPHRASAKAVKAALVDLYRPVWNKALRGFGASYHRASDERARHASQSLWDTYHTGRPGGGETDRTLEEATQALVKGVPVALARYQRAQRLLASYMEGLEDD